MHALRQFTAEHPEIDKEWFEKSNYLGLLSVPDEKALVDLIEQVIAHDISYSIFKEPDIENKITAIALAPCPKSKKLCSRIPLALRNK